MMLASRYTAYERAKLQAWIWAQFRDDADKKTLDDDERQALAEMFNAKQWDDLPPSMRMQISLKYEQGVKHAPEPESIEECECGDDFAFHLHITGENNLDQRCMCGTCAQEYQNGWNDAIAAVLDKLGIKANTETDIQPLFLTSKVDAYG